MSRPAHFNEAGWRQVLADRGVGDVLEGQVVKVLPFGAFIEVGDGVHGLAPATEWPSLPEVQARVRVRIRAIDTERCRVALDPA